MVDFGGKGSSGGLVAYCFYVFIGMVSDQSRIDRCGFSQYGY